MDPVILNDSTLDAALATDRPVLLLFTNGDGLRGDFRVAYNKLAAETQKFVVARIDPTTNPAAVARFGVGDKPTLIGVYCGEEVVRRNRPWGTDLPLALEFIEGVVKERNPQDPNETVQPVQVNKEQQMSVIDKPVDVTDATFDQEVLGSDLPVLVDFWAEWCGPCRMVAPVLEKLAGEFAGQIKIAKVDVDANPGLSQAFRIQSIPNLMIIKNRTVIFNQPGALPEEPMRQLIQQAIEVDVPMPDEAQQDAAE